jgi:hypothetical protein
MPLAPVLSSGWTGGVIMIFSTHLYKHCIWQQIVVEVHLESLAAVSTYIHAHYDYHYHYHSLNCAALALLHPCTYSCLHAYIRKIDMHIYKVRFYPVLIHAHQVGCLLITAIIITYVIVFAR